MSSPTASNQLKALYNALPVSAHGGEDPAAFYVNRADSKEHDCVGTLRRLIDWSEQSNETYLFSGLRGAGKTTELSKLIFELRNNGVAAYYCDATDYVNINDPNISLTELMLIAMAGFADAVRTDLDVDLIENNIWERAKRLLNSNVQLRPSIEAKPAGLGVGAKVEISLQENPDFRNQLLEFSRSSTAFFDEVIQFSGELSDRVKEARGCKKVVLIVDSLERLSAPPGEEHVLFNSLKELFYNDPRRLRLPSVSVIYSAPPYLHAVLPNVEAGFSKLITLPNFKVIDRPGKGQAPAPSTTGLEQMASVLARRFPDWEQVLSRDVANHLALMSGGNVRRYFELIRTLCLKAGLLDEPLPLLSTQAPVVEHTINEWAKPLTWLNAQDLKWLQRFMTEDSPGHHIDDLQKDLPAIIRLFDHSLVLNYQNGGPWYQVPQLVRDHVDGLQPTPTA